MNATTIDPGLAHVTAAETNISEVRGDIGELTIAGFALERFAPYATFEESSYLVWHAQLPTSEELAEFHDSLASWRFLPAATKTLLEGAAAANIPAMDALRMAAGTFSLDAPSDPVEQRHMLLARLPTVVATYWRLRNGLHPVAPDTKLSHAGNFLYMLDGKLPSAARTRALNTYLNTVIDHGLNASTFTARVIISTASDQISAVVGAIGALKGPLHGGAPGPALDMVFDIETPENAAPYLRAKLQRGERLMGFGHRVYKVRDPRADVLADAAETLYHLDGELSLYELALHVEQAAIAELAAYKPGQKLQTNVEFYTALLLHGLDIETDLFSPIFAMSRAAGWLAHCQEQLATGRIVRPRARYSGEHNRTWVTVEDR